MSSPIRIRDTVALLLVIAAVAIGLGQGVSADLHVQTAQILAAECQGFEALATVGGRPLTCSTDVAAVGNDLPIVPVVAQPKA